MKNQRTISNLKLRLGWGQVGNDRITNYLSLMLYSKVPIGIGTDQMIALQPKQLANDDLRWEASQSTNLGLDLGLFDNRLNFTADFFIKDTKDLLMNASLPGVTGFTSQWQNIGKIRNKGIELAISSTNFDTRGGFRWTTNFNISFIRNELRALASGEQSRLFTSGWSADYVNDYVARVGSSLGDMYGYEFDGITREEAQTGSNTAIIFGICILLIYLILSALYESFLIPFAVILSVPCGLMGSFLLAKMMGLENNIYLQTGIIMLIGLLSKTAILITEYAADRRAAGMSLTQAAVSAAKARLRPILMTVLTCVFGMIPLVLSHGVGANGNSTLGAGVIGGMIVGTLALLFLVPTLFIVFQTLQEKVKPLEFDPDPQWAVRAELEECKNEKEEE